MKKLLLCSVGAFCGPPIAYAAFAETGAGLNKEKVLGRDDTMVGPLPYVMREAEGLDRGATGDLLTDGNDVPSIIDLTAAERGDTEMAMDGDTPKVA